MSPVPACTPYASNSCNRVMEKHEPCQFSHPVNDHQSTTPIFFRPISLTSRKIVLLNAYTCCIHLIVLFKKANEFFYSSNVTDATTQKTLLANVVFVKSFSITTTTSPQLILITVTTVESFVAGRNLTEQEET